jgi:hypothetical protein
VLPDAHKFACALAGDYYLKRISPERRARKSLNNLKAKGWTIAETPDGLTGTPPGQPGVPPPGQSITPSAARRSVTSQASDSQWA